MSRVASIVAVVFCACVIGLAVSGCTDTSKKEGAKMEKKMQGTVQSGMDTKTDGKMENKMDAKKDGKMENKMDTKQKGKMDTK